MYIKLNGFLLAPILISALVVSPAGVLFAEDLDSDRIQLNVVAKNTDGSLKTGSEDALQRLIAKANQVGYVSVTVRISAEYTPAYKIRKEPLTDSEAQQKIDEQHRRVSDKHQKVTERIKTNRNIKVKKIQRLSRGLFFRIYTDAEGLRELAKDPDVVSFSETLKAHPTLDGTNQQITSTEIKS